MGYWFMGYWLTLSMGYWLIISVGYWLIPCVLESAEVAAVPFSAEVLTSER